MISELQRLIRQEVASVTYPILASHLSPSLGVISCKYVGEPYIVKHLEGHLDTSPTRHFVH